jgi:putative colanic acid biosynthesis acetyltransferase WcaF
VSQHTYVCGGTHDLQDPQLPLLVGDIDIGRDVFIGAKALILPGVVIGESAVIGAGAVVSRDMPAGMICAGNPCRPIKARGEMRPAGPSA